MNRRSAPLECSTVKRAMTKPVHMLKRNVSTRGKFGVSFFGGGRASMVQETLARVCANLTFAFGWFWHFF